MTLQIIKPLLFSTFFILFSTGFAQTTALEKLENYTKEDSIKVNLLNEVAFNHLKNTPKKSLEYIKKAELLSNKLNYTKGHARSLLLNGEALIKLSRFEEAQEYLQKSITIYETLNDKIGISKCYSSFGTSYFFQGDYALSHDYYEKALEINKKLNNDVMVASSLNQVGMIYAVKGDFYNALEYFNKALKLEEVLQNKYQISKISNNLGVLYLKRSNYPKAIEYYTKSVMVNEQSGDKLESSTGLYNIGLAYRQYENYEKALEYYNKSLEIEKEYGGQRNIAFCLMGIGTVYTEQGKPIKAIDFLKQALEIFTEIKDDTHISSSLNNLGDAFLVDKNYTLALKHYQKALKINIKKNTPSSTSLSYIKIATIHYKRKEYNKALSNVLSSQKIANKHEFLEYKKDISELLSNIYSDTKNYKKAYESHLEYKKLNDSIFNKKNIEKIAQLESEHKYNKRLLSAKEREITLKEEMKIRNKELAISKQQKLWGVIGFLGLTILLGFIIFFLRIRNLKSESENILTEQKLLRSQMTPHFIFNSLSVLQGIILNKEETKSIKYLSGFSKLLRLTLENSRHKLVLLITELQAIEHYLNLQNLGTEVPYNYTITLDSSINQNDILIPPMLIQPFIENAIEHGFKNKKEDKQIHVTIAFHDTNLVCSIIDNGIGIDSYLKEGSTQKKSLSTTITSERLKMFSKEFNQQTNISIEDRKTDNEHGTTVILTLPYKSTKND